MCDVCSGIVQLCPYKCVAHLFMDTVQKLQLLGDQMALEPAEESESTPRPTGVANPNRVAACGHSPAELRRIFGNGLPSPVGDFPDGGREIPISMFAHVANGGRG